MPQDSPHSGCERHTGSAPCEHSAAVEMVALPAGSCQGRCRPVPPLSGTAGSPLGLHAPACAAPSCDSLHPRTPHPASASQTPNQGVGRFQTNGVVITYERTYSQTPEKAASCTPRHGRKPGFIQVLGSALCRSSWCSSSIEGYPCRRRACGGCVHRRSTLNTSVTASCSL